MRLKLLVLDNYDSFTYNLVHLIEKVSDIDFIVKRNDQIHLDEVESFDKIILSPGPGLPKDAGIMPELLKKYASQKNILGVCLGLQAIGEVFGAKLKNLNEVVHGQATSITIVQPDLLFESIPTSFKVGRYHSWVINESDLPSTLTVTAVDEKGHIMALRHNTLNIRGVQFHPESILSEYGETLIRNWINS